MKKLLLIGQIIALATSGEGGFLDLNYGMSLKFGMSFDALDDTGTEYLLNVPLNKTQAVSMNWTLTDGCSCSGSTGYDELKAYCVPGYNVCVLIEENSGGMVGLQIGILENNFTATFNMTEQGWSRCTLGGDTYCVIKNFYVGPEWMAKSAEDKKNSFNSSVILQEDAVWLTGNNGVLMKVEADTTNLTTDTKWTKQNYMVWMGQHYYYNMSSTTECTSTQLFPSFLLEHDYRLVGTGIAFFGTLTQDENAFNYFESPSKAIVQYNVNHGPDCLYDLAVRTLHIYFTSTPWKIIYG